MNEEQKQALEAVNKTIHDMGVAQKEATALLTKAGADRSAEHTEKMDAISASVEAVMKRHDDIEVALKRRVSNDETNAENKDVRDELNNFRKRAVIQHVSSETDNLTTKVYEAWKSYMNKSLRVQQAPNKSEGGVYRITPTSDEFAAALIVSKAIEGTTDVKGGYLLPEIEEMRLERQLWIMNPIREHCTVTSISEQAFLRLFQRGNAGFGWVGETEVRPTTTNQTFAEINIPVNEIYAKPRVTQNNLDDARYNVGEILVNEVARVFGIEEAKKFTNGTGTDDKQPTGLLGATINDTSDDDTRGLSEFYRLKTKGTFKATAPLKVLQLYGELKREYTSNAKWYMNRKTVVQILRLQDKDENYLVQKDPRQSIQFMLWGYPIVELDDFPNVSATGADGTETDVANAYPIFFGDMKRAMQIIDRQSLRILVDPYVDKPHVQYYCTRRVGAKPIDGASGKFLQITAA